MHSLEKNIIIGDSGCSGNAKDSMKEYRDNMFSRFKMLVLEGYCYQLLAV